MEEIKVGLDDYHFVIINPEIHISTADAFRGITAHEKPIHVLKEIIAQPVSTWKDNLINEFEEPVFKKHPVLEEIKQKIYASGAEYASMTGTGSSIYGIFHNSKKTANLLAGEKYRVYILNQSH